MNVGFAWRLAAKLSSQIVDMQCASNASETGAAKPQNRVFCCYCMIPSIRLNIQMVLFLSLSLQEHTVQILPVLQRQPEESELKRSLGSDQRI